VVFILFFSWPVTADWDDAAGATDRQQRVMVVGNNNVFEVGCRILSIIIAVFTLLYQFGLFLLCLFDCYAVYSLCSSDGCHTHIYSLRFRDK